MPSSKLTSKYQATIPKDIREKLHLEAGDLVAFEETEGQVIIRKVESIDLNYLKSIETTLEAEWLSEEDDIAYADL